MRPSFRYLTAAVAMLALAACGESTAPNSASPTKTLSPSAPAFDFGSTNRTFGQQSADFTIGSSAKHVDVNGLFTLDFPAGSCPKLSDSRSCESSVKVHATTRLTLAGVVVDFSPHLTFGKAVTLSTDIFAPVIKLGHTYFAAHPSGLNALALYYAPSLTASPVADFSSDASLMTHVSLKTGLVWRSIWHFSGYLMAGGDSCDPADGNPSCVWVEDQR